MRSFGNTSPLPLFSCLLFSLWKEPFVTSFWVLGLTMEPRRLKGCFKTLGKYRQELSTGETSNIQSNPSSGASF